MVKKIDYLTALRKEREHKESLKGDKSTTVDFDKLKQKAKMKQLITVKQPAFLTHLRDEPNLSLAKEVDEVSNTKAVMKKQMKGKGKGKEATMKELEQVKKQRIAQKRFMKTEYVSKELMSLCYSLLEHL